MARFTVASKALRGPFKKLIRNLEIALRRPVVKKLGAAGRKVAERFQTKDARTALAAAREEAARLLDVGPRPPAAVSGAVDRSTGRVVSVGHCNHSTPVPAELAAKFPDPPLEKRWSVTNCGEVDVASQAIASGSRFEDLVIRTVHTKDGSVYPPCDNCDYWVPGER